jgi:uncharacterized protein (TIGR02118 family)
VIKLVCFVRRRPGLAPDAFHAHWRERHGPLVRENPAAQRYLVRYEQNHRVAKDYERERSPDFDGVAIQWFRSYRDFVAMISDPAWRTISDDEERFLDRAATTYVMTEDEEVVVDAR